MLFQLHLYHASCNYFFSLGLDNQKWQFLISYLFQILDCMIQQLVNLGMAWNCRRFQGWVNRSLYYLGGHSSRQSINYLQG